MKKSDTQNLERQHEKAFLSFLPLPKSYLGYFLIFILTVSSICFEFKGNNLSI